MEKSQTELTKKQEFLEEDEIDLLPIIKNLIHWLWLLALVTVVGFVCTYFVMKQLVAPEYTADFSAFINNKSATSIESIEGLSSSDLTASQYLAEAYNKILKSRKIYEQVAGILGSNFNYTYEEYDQIFTVTNEEDSGLISGSIVSKDPTEAYQIADAITQVAPGIMSETIDGSSMKIIDTPQIPTESSGPNYLKTGVIGGLLCFLVAAAVIVIITLKDSRVKGIDDFESKMNLVIIGTIHDLASGQHAYSYYGKKENR